MLEFQFLEAVCAGHFLGVQFHSDFSTPPFLEGHRHMPQGGRKDPADNGRDSRVKGEQKRIYFESNHLS